MDFKDSPPNRAELIGLVAENMYSGKILNNSHRGDVVEMLVLSALGSEWRSVSLGWHPWDLQKGTGESRVRIQVKHCAALQLWGPTKKMQVKFGWSDNPPDYFAKDNPGEAIESEGWFCDVFVIGVHRETNEELVDQVDAEEWRFLVIPTGDLEHRQGSMVLSKALRRWPLVEWRDLKKAVDSVA